MPYNNRFNGKPHQNPDHRRNSPGRGDREFADNPRGGRGDHEFSGPRGGRDTRGNDFNRQSDRSDRNYERNTPRDFQGAQDDTENMIIGRNPVLEALKAGIELDIIYISGEISGTLGVIAAKARETGVPVKSVDDRKLSLMSAGRSHQGVIATIAQTKYLELDELLALPAQESGEPPLYVVCDGIEDPHNLGAIIRTAEAAGARGLIIPKRRNVSVNATVYKTSAGAAAVLPICRVPNLAAALETLKSNGVWIYGADMDGESAYSVDFSGAVCLVIGAEGNGISTLIRKKCDVLVSLPMCGQINSLNASVAAGILLYEVRRQRG